MSYAFDARANLQDVAQELADSGKCDDFWDIEMELLARGHSASDAHRATADDSTRESLNQRCRLAKRALRQRA